jgi:hypothetical protein
MLPNMVVTSHVDIDTYNATKCDSESVLCYFSSLEFKQLYVASGWILDRAASGGRAPENKHRYA